MASRTVPAVSRAPKSSTELTIHDNDPLSPNTGWGIEALRLAGASGWDPDRAFDYVLLRYLSEGDSRPLLHLLGYGKIPGRLAQKYLAVMIDPKCRVCFPNVSISYEIRFEESRKPGRPKSDESEFHFAIVWRLLMAGAKALSEGIQPNERFWKCIWHCLIAARDPVGYRKIFGTDFPMKAKLVRTDGAKGRRCDPELEMRDQALAWFVTGAIERGAKYEFTLDEVAKENHVSKETVRNAYSKYQQ